MLKIIYKKTDELLPYVNNARTHSDEQITQIAASIKEFGFATLESTGEPYGSHT